MFNTIFLSLLFIIGCTAPSYTENHFRYHLTRQEFYWKRYPLNKPLEEKFYTKVPESLLKFLDDTNQWQGFSNHPKAASLDESQINDIKSALKEVPAPIKKLIEKRLHAIFFVQDLGGSGMTESVTGFKTGYMVFDVTVLNRTANEWCTWKEASPFFTKDDTFSLKCEIATGADDNRKNAFQYILLHELGHILNLDNTMVGDWAEHHVDPKELLKKHDFLNLSWIPNPKWSKDKMISKFESKFDGDFGLRREVHYYTENAPMHPRELPELYTKLEKTNFPTLYASTNPYDDWAETFVNYVHVELLKKPFRINIYSKDKLEKTFLPCWKESRCRSKLEVLKKFLQLP